VKPTCSEKTTLNAGHTADDLLEWVDEPPKPDDGEVVVLMTVKRFRMIIDASSQILEGRADGEPFEFAVVKFARMVNDALGGTELSMLKDEEAMTSGEKKTWAETAATERCDHGITFDEVEAEKLLAASPRPKNAVGFILSNPASAEVRKRWPRGWFTEDKPCPKGCGFVGISYASQEHYRMGDW
jgi:hypothetical protein